MTFIFNGFLWFRMDFQKSKQTLNISFFFGNYEILRKSDKVSKNFNNKKALEIPKYLAGNWTRTKDEVPNIRDGLLRM